MPGWRHRLHQRNTRVPGATVAGWNGAGRARGPSGRLAVIARRTGATIGAHHARTGPADVARGPARSSVAVHHPVVLTGRYAARAGDGALPAWHRGARHAFPHATQAPSLQTWPDPHPLFVPLSISTVDALGRAVCTERLCDLARRRCRAGRPVRARQRVGYFPQDHREVLDDPQASAPTARASRRSCPERAPRPCAASSAGCCSRARRLTRGWRCCRAARRPPAVCVARHPQTECAGARRAHQPPGPGIDTGPGGH
jgi:hypothetical protein